jgi:hypothetical protein
MLASAKRSCTSASKRGYRKGNETDRAGNQALQSHLTLWPRLVGTRREATKLYNSASYRPRQAMDKPGQKVEAHDPGDVV